MKSIVILFSGEGTNLINLIETLHGCHCNVAAAITNRPDAPGIPKATSRGVTVEVIDHAMYNEREAFDRALVERINQYMPDLIVMAGFMRILSPVFFSVSAPAVNVHPSLLPAFKGARAIERSFESDAPQGGISIHWVTPELDSGDVIAQEAFDKSSDETLESFTDKIHALEYRLYPETIRRLLQS